MHVLFFCKFDEDLLENEVAIIRTAFPYYIPMGDLRARSYHCPIFPKVITYKSDEEPIQNDIAIVRTTFSCL